MRRCHLDCSRAKAGVYRFICNYGDLAANYGQDGHAPNQVFVARVFRTNGHGGITQDGLRARGSNADILGWLMLITNFWFQGIAHIGEGSRRIDVIDLQVGEGAHTARTPVDDALPTVDQPFFVEAHEYFAHSFR